MDEWSTFVMDEEAGGISYSQHLSCFIVGSHPGTAGTTSAILRYASKSVFIGQDPETAKPLFREEVRSRSTPGHLDPSHPAHLPS